MGRSSQTSQSLTRQRRLPGKIISAMSPIGKIVLMVVMMAIVDQSTSTISFARLGAQKDNLISAVGGIKRELLSPVAGIARGIFDAKKSIVQPIIGLKSNLAKAKFGIAKNIFGVKANRGCWTPRSTSSVDSEKEKAAIQCNLIVVD